MTKGTEETKESEESSKKSWREHQTIRNSLESVDKEDYCIIELFNEYFAKFYATGEQPRKEYSAVESRELRSIEVVTLCNEIKRRADKCRYSWDETIKLFTAEEVDYLGMEMVDL